MTINKEEYWKNRAKGLRGQGQRVRTSQLTGFAYADYTGPYKPSTKPLSRYAIRKNTKRARKYAAREQA